MAASSWMQICTAGAPSMASYAQVRADLLSLVAPMIADVSIAHLGGGVGTERNEQFIRIHTQCGFQIRRKER